MRACKACGGTIKYVNNHLAKCEYCGRMYALNGDTLNEVSPEKAYSEAVALAKRNTESDLLAAISIWEALGSYKDSAARIQECRDYVAKARVAAEDKRLEDLRQAELNEIERKRKEYENKKKRKVIYLMSAVVSVVVIVIVAMLVVEQLNKISKYEEAITLYENGKYKEAILLLEELDDYADASEQIENIKNTILEEEYTKAVKLYESQQYEEALVLFEGVSNYSDSSDYSEKIASILKEQRYQKAIELYSSNKYEDALVLFEELSDYADTNSYVENVKNAMTERETVYKKGVAYFDAGLYGKAIVELTPIVEYSDVTTYIRQSASKLYEQSTKAYKEEKYAEAKEMLVLIPEDCDEYIQANSLLAEIEQILYEKQREESYNQAILAYENGQYDTAQQLFIGVGNYSEAGAYLSAIGTMYYNQAQELYKAGSYIECGDILEYIDTLEEWSQYAIALALKQEASNIYIEMVCEEAKKICRAEGYSAMEAYIDGSVCSVLSKDLTGRLKEECEIEVVCLVDKQPFVGETDEFWYSAGDDTDNVGNIYAYSIHCRGGGYANEITYALDEKYTVLTGDLGLREQDNDIKDGIWIEFYADGKKLGETIHFYAGVRPYTFEIDVACVKDLKLVSTSNSIHRGGFLLTNGFIVSE